jgi:hypothetical protein
MTRRGVIPAIAVAVVVASCATGRYREPQRLRKDCEFIVYNRTPLALDIRLRVRALSTATIGALNPGELLTHAVPCAERRVWIEGREIPWQVGAWLRFGALHGSADLVEGERVSIALHWP